LERELYGDLEEDSEFKRSIDVDLRTTFYADQLPLIEILKTNPNLKLKKLSR